MIVMDKLLTCFSFFMYCLLKFVLLYAFPKKLSYAISWGKKWVSNKVVEIIWLGNPMLGSILLRCR